MIQREYQYQKKINRFIKRSILEKNKYIFHKEINKESIDLLKEKYLDNHKFNNIIAHTRWATHGVISKNNCHPHISNNSEISLVHNEIIENYLELKNFFVNKNYIFTSETDTEVIVNLIEYYNINSNSFDDAINNHSLHLNHYQIQSYNWYLNVKCTRDDSELEKNTRSKKKFKLIDELSNKIDKELRMKHKLNKYY